MALLEFARLKSVWIAVVAIVAVTAVTAHHHPRSRARADLSRADLGRPDLGRPDLGRPDLGRPDLSRPDLGRPDLSRVDQSAVIATTPLSTECASKSPAYEGRRAFRRLHQAMKERRSGRVLAIGSSSTVGVGASQPAATFTVQLEADLERAFKGADFDIIARGVSGEAAAATAVRLREEALRLKPDLIVWQVGTNDGVSHVDQAVFSSLLTSTLHWIAQQGLDVVLIDPQYVGKLAADEHYRRIVQAITDVARRERVPLVHRYQAMEELSAAPARRSYVTTDHLHLNDLGYRCMAEFASQAIEAGVRMAGAEPDAIVQR